MANVTLCLGWEARSQDGDVSQHSHFTCTVSFQPTSSTPKKISACCISTACGDRLGRRNIWKSKPRCDNKWKAMKLNTVHAKKFLNEHHWLIDICSKGSACRKKRATFHLFNFTCSVWGDLSMIKHNYSNVNQWASRHPETVIRRHSQPCVNSIGYGTAVSWSKLRVMYAAKQPPKPLPSLAESLAVHRLISGTMDEQSLR